MRSVVVCEFREREERAPVVLLVVAIHAEVLLKRLVNSFSLTVSFRVITRGEVDAHVQGIPKRAEKPGDEFRTTVTSDMIGNSMLGKDMGDEVLG